MNREEAKKWLEYHNNGIKPSRYKLRSRVFSDKGICAEVHFSLHGYQLTLLPLPDNFYSTETIEGFMPAFECEVISESDFHSDGNNFDIHTCLDKVLPLVNFNYRLPMDYKQWEEHEGAWIASPGGGAACYGLSTYKKLPKDNIHEIVNAYEEASKKTDKSSNIAAKIRKILKEAVELEPISKRYSFLSYYSIIEIISEHFSLKNIIPSENNIAKDIARLSLSSKGSQRTKIYFLLLAIEGDFDIKECVTLSDLRNDIAHGEQDINPSKLELCKSLAYWASECFVIEITKNPYKFTQ